MEGNKLNTKDSQELSGKQYEKLADWGERAALRVEPERVNPSGCGGRRRRWIRVAASEDEVVARGLRRRHDERKEREDREENQFELQ